MRIWVISGSNRRCCSAAKAARIDHKLQTTTEKPHLGGDEFKGRNGRRGHKAQIVALALLMVVSTCFGQTNSWVNANSGRWDDSYSWSLGMVPADGQSVWITNGNQKTVTITADTASSPPLYLSVGDLTLAGSNTLVVDHFDSNVFQVMNGLTVSNGAAVWNVDSAVVLNGSPALALAGGSFYQDGGSVTSSGGTRVAGDFYLIDGDASLGFVYMNSGTIQQFGGNATVSMMMQGATYYQHGGMLTSRIGPYYFGGTVFVQDGGTNVVLGRADNVSGLWLNSFGLNEPPEYWVMSGGTLLASNANIEYGGRFSQTGGAFRVTNDLSISGAGDERGHPIVWNFGTYSIDGGSLQAQSVQLANQAGSYSQSGGTASVSGDFQFTGNTGEMVGTLGLSGGTLMCSNLLNAGGVVDIEQSGGSLVVSNLLAIDGYFVGYQYYSYVIPPRFVRYDFSGGTVNASNIELSAEWVIGSSSNAGRIVNPGYFQTSGILDIGNANEQLGRFILASNAQINFTGETTKLGFADSHGEAWANGSRLTVSNWNGAVTGGGDHQLRFGTNASGLTSAQVGQIRFVDPSGFPRGTYAAKILNDGEVVPDAPVVSAAAANGALVISWADSSYSLQSATNVLGPWTNVAGATSPYTNLLNGGAQEFFRLER